jgi:hypothetical protein
MERRWRGLVPVDWWTGIVARAVVIVLRGGVGMLVVFEAVVTAVDGKKVVRSVG